MPKSGPDAAAGSDLRPLGDPDDQTGDFADEHEQFVVDEPGDESGGKETESPGDYAGGLDREGPP
ncbi:hypothetical protein ACQP2F_11750 [Actinoplanes sp. CA-030573]|uniref:hypothetical protein n=1 Tax=Actinoplanes sp. CA-030573 TaxID=3239898 RepID=UPI003D8AD0D5